MLQILRMSRLSVFKIVSFANTNSISDTFLVLQVYAYSWIALLGFVAIFKVEFCFI